MPMGTISAKVITDASYVQLKQDGVERREELWLKDFNKNNFSDTTEWVQRNRNIIFKIKAGQSLVKIPQPPIIIYVFIYLLFLYVFMYFFICSFTHSLIHSFIIYMAHESLKIISNITGKSK